MKRLSLLQLLGLLLLSTLGCAQKQPSLEQKESPLEQKLPPMQWTDATVAGLSMSLDDPVEEEDFQFNKGGDVAATIGKKDGPEAGPILHWSIVHGRLQIGDNQIFDELTLVSRDASTIVVTNHVGKTLRFKILAQ